VATADGLAILAAAAEHSRPTIALRFETATASFVHSADTGPCDRVVELARGADLLTHDCGGLEHRVQETGSPHASARAAGEAASRAGVAALRLIHLGEDAEQDEAALVAEAAEAFGGSVGVAYDGAVYRVPGDRHNAPPR